jgi:hypothetical protein
VRKEDVKVDCIEDDLYAGEISEIIGVSCEQASLAQERPEQTGEICWSKKSLDYGKALTQ